jgi:hypothetical protein
MNHNNYFTKYIIGLLIILLIFIICYDFLKTKESFKVNKKLTKQADSAGKEIEKNIMNTLTKKLGAIFIQIGDIFKQLLNILKEVANKLISLPGCIFTYAIKEVINTFNSLYKRILPNFIKKIFSFIYKYTFRYVFDFIGYITGYDNSVKKCYGFDISLQMKNINSSIKKIGSSF